MQGISKESVISMSTKENVSSNHYKVGGGGTWSIGNGQVHDAISPSYEVSKTLNCMCDPMKILVIKDGNNSIRESSSR